MPKLRHHLGEECLPSGLVYCHQISPGSRSWSRGSPRAGPLPEALLPRAAAVTRQMLAALAAPLPGPSPVHWPKHRHLPGSKRKMYELASNRKICHLELRTHLWNGQRVLVMHGASSSPFPPVFSFEWEYPTLWNFFQRCITNWNCNNMEIKSSCLCPALLLPQVSPIDYFKVLSWLLPMRKCMVILHSYDFLV